MLLEIGKKEPSHEITEDSISIASLLVLDFFLPSFSQVMDRILSNIKTNKIEKAISVIRKMGGTCNRGTLIKNGHFTAKECDEIIEAMLIGSIVDEKKVKETKLVTYILKSDEKIVNVQSTELTDLFANLRNLRNVRTYTVGTTTLAKIAKIDNIPTCSALPEGSSSVCANIAKIANIEQRLCSSVVSVEEAARILEEEGPLMSLLFLDIETTGLNPLTSELVTLQLLTPSGKSMIIKDPGDLEALKPKLEKSLIVGHNIKLDSKFLKYQYGITLCNVYDTFIAEIAISGENLLDEKEHPSKI